MTDRKTVMVKTDNANLEVVLRGEKGPWLVMLPAAGRGADDFSILADELAKAGWSTVAVNPRGAGNSKGALKNLTLHDYARDVAGVIDALDGAPAVVLGHAWGNRVARCLAADHPGLVHCLILLAAGGKVPMAPEVGAAMLKLRARLAEPEALTALKTAFFAAASDPSPWMSGFWPEAVRAAGMAAESTALDDWWSGGAAPMLVIQGKEDRCALPQNGYLLKTECGDRITVVDIDNAAHALLSEQPEVIAGLIIEYLGSGFETPQ